mgnify:FL=1
MKNVKITLVALYAAILSLLYPIMIAEAAVTCFKKTEYQSGFNKICIYNCLGSDKAITIKNTQLCPLTIQG